MTEIIRPAPSSIDFRGNIRGKCKDLSCDCDEYLKTEQNTCGMCGCYPGKHELIADTSKTLGLSSALSLAISQLTPSKTAEIDLGTGDVVVHSNSKSKLSEVDEVQKKINFEERQSTSSMDVDVADKERDPDYVPEHADDSMNEGSPEDTAKEFVSASRNKSEEKSAFTSAAVQRDFLSMDLNKKITKFGLMKNEDAFVAEAASFLTVLAKSDKPTQTEQSIFCSKMVELYPELKTTIGKTPWAAFKTTLSRHLIQRRYRIKNTTPKSSPSIRSCALVPAGPTEETEESIDDMMNQLKVVTEKSADSVVLKLIRKTAEARRILMFADDQNKMPKQIVQMWPHLLIADWLVQDFFTFKGFKKADVEKKISIFIRRLAKMQEKSDDDKDHVECLYSVSLKLKKQSKKLANIITIIEPLGVLTSLTPLDGEAPRLVFCVREAVDQCFVNFDANTVELPAPSAERALLLLMAAYYVMDIKYPEVYANFLRLLDREVSDKPECIKASQRTLFRFAAELEKVQVD